MTYVVEASLFGPVSRRRNRDQLLLARCACVNGEGEACTKLVRAGRSALLGVGSFLSILVALSIKLVREVAVEAREREGRFKSAGYVRHKRVGCCVVGE